MDASRVAALALALALGSACGCHSWRAVPQSSESPRPLSARSRVVRTDGARIEITRGLVTGDSVVGLLRGGARIGVPRDSVARVEERRLSWGRTVAVTAVSLAIYFGIAYAISGPGAVPTP